MKEDSLGFSSVTQPPQRVANLHVSIILQTAEIDPLQAADIHTHLYCKFTIETLPQALLQKKTQIFCVSFYQECSSHRKHQKTSSADTKNLQFK